MRAESAFLRDQATACRQLALISTAEDARKLRALAAEYDQLATKGNECRTADQEAMKQPLN